MSGYKILMLLAAIAFLIGALVPTIITGGTPRSIGWTDLGLAFVAFAFFVGAH